MPAAALGENMCRSETSLSAPPTAHQPRRKGSQAHCRRLRHRRGGHAFGAASSGKRRALDADVEVDDAVVVHVDLPVVVEVAVVPAGGAEVHVEVDSAVIIDVDLAVE